MVVGRPASQPDAPQSFGRRATWVAVRCDDGEEVVKALGLRTVCPANWAAGLDAVGHEGVFVTPSIDGYVLAVGSDFHGNGDYGAIVEPLLQRLSSTFEEAAWFVTHDEAEHHGWALARRGKLLRAYAYQEEDGEVLWQGEVTDVERALDCFVDDPRDRSDDGAKWWPDEATVLRIAARWTVDPSGIAARSLPLSCGWLGRL